MTEQLMIVNSPGHQYDGLRVTLAGILSETGKVLVHVRDHIYVTLKQSEVVLAPSSKRVSTNPTQTRGLIA